MIMTRVDLRKILGKRRLAIFDLDGTIVDTEQINYISYQRAFRKMLKIILSQTDWDMYFSGKKPQDSIAQYLYEKKNTETDTSLLITKLLKEIKKEKLRRFRTRSIKLIPGFKRFISILRKMNIRCALCTSTVKKFTDIVLTKTSISPYFDLVLTGEVVDRGKPDPAVYLKAMQKMEMRPKESIVFEDSKAGLVAARKSGAYVVKIGKQKISNKYYSLSFNDYRDLLAKYDIK